MSRVGSVGEFGFDLVARLDRLEAGLELGRQKANKAAKDIEKSVSKGGISGVTQAALKAFATFSLVEGGIKAATVASEAFRGNWEEAGTLIKQLPLGIGPIAQGIEGLILSTTSWGRSINKAKEEFIEMERIAAVFQARNEDTLKKSLAAQKEILKSKRDLAALIAPEDGRALLQSEQASSDRIAALQSQLKQDNLTKQAKAAINQSIQLEKVSRDLRREQFLDESFRNAQPEFTTPTFGRALGRFEAPSIGVAGSIEQSQLKALQKSTDLLRDIKKLLVPAGTLN